MSEIIDKHKHLVMGFALILLGAPLLPIVLGIYMQFSPAESVFQLCMDDPHCISEEWRTTYWIIILLLIPYAIQLLIGCYGYIKMKDGEQAAFMFNFCLLTFVSVFTYSLAWFLYNWGCNSEYLSYLLLFIIFILVTVLLYLTFLFLRRGDFVSDNSKNRFFNFTSLANYRKGLRKLHFLAIMHFFAVFLSIAFIAGFALAFHNRANNYTALHMENFEEVVNKDITLCKIPPLTKESKVREIKDRFETCFYFNSDGVTLETLNNEDFVEQNKKAAGEVETKELALKNSNYNEFENISECIISMEKKRFPLVYIVGRTDPKTPKKMDFSDNYQLSSVRASNLYLNLTEKLSKKQYNSMRDIEWRVLSVSSDKNSTLLSSPCQQLGKDELSNKRIVEVVIESATDSTSIDRAKPKTKKLSVMDYMYFSLYTITTTGYGDIKPVTSYAKLICSIENIIEVFFLVIFVNVLISFKESRTIDKLGEIETNVDNKLRKIETKIENQQSPNN